MSINIFIFLALLLFFILQENFEPSLSDKKDTPIEFNGKRTDQGKLGVSKNLDNSETLPHQNSDHALDLNKEQSMAAHLRYRIAPKIPDFSASELSGKTQELLLELSVNEQGDIEQVILKNNNTTEVSNKIFQKLKPAFLEAKFYPYLENGKPRPFRISQPIVIN